MTSAPNAFSASIFSFDCLSVVVKMHLYPFTTATMASPMPVLPEVPSMIVPPGLSTPARSASSIMRTAMRSLIELPGLNVSSFARTVARTSPLVIVLIRTSGVSPIASRIVSQIFATVLVYLLVHAAIDRRPRRRPLRWKQAQADRRIRWSGQLRALGHQRGANGLTPGLGRTRPTPRLRGDHRRLEGPAARRT